MPPLLQLMASGAFSQRALAAYPGVCCLAFLLQHKAKTLTKTDVNQALVRYRQTDALPGLCGSP